MRTVHAPRPAAATRCDCRKRWNVADCLPKPGPSGECQIEGGSAHVAEHFHQTRLGRSCFRAAGGPAVRREGRRRGAGAPGGSGRDMHGFPPAILTTGTRDLLLSNTVRSHRALRAAGVEPQLEVYEGQSHAQYLFDDRLPETSVAFGEIAAFFDKHLGK